MIARTVCFGSPGRLTTHLEQLVWDGTEGAHATIPIEDLGFVILETGQISISTAALQKLSAANVAVVFCDDKHLPSAQLLAYTGHTTAQETIEAQLAASDAVNGRLWRQVVRAKIRNQSALLVRLGQDAVAGRLRTLADTVKNGDPQNNEAQAARLYFQALRPSADFLRDPEGCWPNAALNYGYAVLRAAVARALVGSGLTCFRGIHHHNRYNAYCLADDLMEPYRPFVDQYVFGGESPFDGQEESLTPAVKRKLLELLTCDVQQGKLQRPLAIALTMTSASLARYFLKKGDELSLPELVP